MMITARFHLGAAPFLDTSVILTLADLHSFPNPFLLPFSLARSFFSSDGGGSSRNVSLAFSSSYISAPGNINLLRICRQHCGYFLANSFSLFFSFESNV